MEKHIVRIMNETMRGAPGLWGKAGRGIAVLDAFLVDGWGSVNSLSASVDASGIATIDFASGDSFVLDAAVEISGAPVAEMDGVFKVIAQTSTSIQIQTATTAANYPGAVMTVKYASCGWEKVYTGTKLAAYRSKDSDLNRRYLRVADTSAATMRWIAYSAMTGVSSGTGQFPTSGQVSGGGYVNKSTADTTVLSTYDLFGDGAMFYFGSQSHEATQAVPPGANDLGVGSMIPFGDPIYLSSLGDVYGTIVGGSPYAAQDHYGCAFNGTVSVGMYLFHERVFAGTGSSAPTAVARASGILGPTGYDTSPQNAGPFLGGIQEKLALARIYTNNNPNSADYQRRTQLPGIYACSNNNLCGPYYPNPFKHRDTFDLDGRRLMAINFTSFGGGMSSGLGFADVTGPWR